MNTQMDKGSKGTIDTSNLKPLKAIIHGPPASGKTTLAKGLCQRYGAHYVSVRSMIDETLQELVCSQQ